MSLKKFLLSKWNTRIDCSENASSPLPSPVTPGELTSLGLFPHMQMGITGLLAGFRAHVLSKSELKQLLLQAVS